MNKLTIRRLSDEEQLPWSLILSADPSEVMAKKYLSHSDIYVAYDGDELIGEYVLSKISDNEMELMNIAVDERHQGKGIGKQLVLDVIDRTKRAGIKSVKVGTGNSSLTQLSFYQKCGFRIVSIEKDFFANNYTEEIVENGIRCVDKIILEIKLTN